MSASENRSRHTQTSSTAVQNLNVQDTEGVTIANSDNVSVVATDYGALEIAGDAIQTAIDGARDVSRGAIDLGFEALGTSRDIVNIGSETALDAQRQSLDFAGEGLGALIDLGVGLFDRAISTAEGALKSAQSNVGGTVQALQGIAREQTTSDASRVQQVVLYALGAMVLIIVLGGMRRG